jgi:predicted amino acid racemase
VWNVLQAHFRMPLVRKVARHVQWARVSHRTRSLSAKTVSQAATPVWKVSPAVLRVLVGNTWMCQRPPFAVTAILVSTNLLQTAPAVLLVRLDYSRVLRVSRHALPVILAVTPKPLENPLV